MYGVRFYPNLMRFNPPMNVGLESNSPYFCDTFYIFILNWFWSCIFQRGVKTYNKQVWSVDWLHCTARAMKLYIHWSNWVMCRLKEETPNIPHCSVLTWCQSKESFKHHYFSSNMDLPLRLKGKKTRKQLLNLE